MRYNERFNVLFALSERAGKSAEPRSYQGLGIAIVPHERGIPSKRESLARVDYVPALCTHTARRYDRLFQLMSDMDESRDRLVRDRWAEKLDKLSGVEDVKVVTRYP